MKKTKNHATHGACTHTSRTYRARDTFFSLSLSSLWKNTIIHILSSIAETNAYMNIHKREISIFREREETRKYSFSRANRVSNEYCSTVARRRKAKRIIRQSFASKRGKLLQRRENAYERFVGVRSSRTRKLRRSSPSDNDKSGEAAKAQR